MQRLRLMAIGTAVAVLTGCAGLFQPPAPVGLGKAGTPPSTKLPAFKKTAAPAPPKVPRAQAATASPPRDSERIPVVCGSKTSCGEISTCAEAYHLLNVCGARQLASGDQGVPCPALCGDTIETMTSRMKAQRSASVPGS